MHSRNVCHYDIKLENIMLDENFNAKIIDFGLSGSKTILSSDVKGTLGYIAPEFCKDTKSKIQLKGEKADVFALGVVLFSMYFGFIPFESTKYSDFENSPLCSGDPQKLEEFLKADCPLTNNILGLGESIEHEFVALLAKMMNRDPSRRPEVSEILLTDPWVRGHILDTEEIEKKVQKLSAFLYEGSRLQ